jgi:hypothetical protein
MSSGRVTLNPMLDYVLAADDELILCRLEFKCFTEFSTLFPLFLLKCCAHEQRQGHAEPHA